MLRPLETFYFLLFCTWECFLVAHGVGKLTCVIMLPDTPCAHR